MKFYKKILTLHPLTHLEEYTSMVAAGLAATTTAGAAGAAGVAGAGAAGAAGAGYMTSTAAGKPSITIIIPGQSDTNLISALMSRWTIPLIITPVLCYKYMSE